jgi:hypothetical protein
LPAVLSLDRPAPVWGLFNTHRSRDSCSLHNTRTPYAVRFPPVPMRGCCGRQGSCASNSCALWLGMVRTPSCSHRLAYETVPAECNEGTAMIEDAPGSPIFWIPPANAWREDSRWKALPKRWIVERTFGWLRRYRGAARTTSAKPHRVRQ